MLVSGAGQARVLTRVPSRAAPAPRPHFGGFRPVSPSVPVRLIDPRGQRFGAGLSAVVLIAATALQWFIVAPLVAVALGVSSALGTRFFVFGRPWPLVRKALRLGPPVAPEPEIPPRFAQALGAVFLAIGSLAFVVAGPAGWLFVLAVAALQALLALTGFCLGCRLYALHWFVPALFDRIIGARPAVVRTKLERVG